MAATTVNPLAPASQLLEGLRDRRISAIELLDLHLDRIRRFNPALNAIVAFDEQNARAAARAADQAMTRGEQQPLQGLPLTIKDSIDVHGLPTTSGIQRRKDHLADADAPVVARLRDAGAVVIGKTNTPPFTSDWQTDNPLFGRTNNPWDLARTPGGSTGGGAAAVSAGLSALEIGSDIGGSIRLPAAFCGIYGHRPSDTAVPRSGQFPGSPLPNVATVLNVMGPLARSADDLDLALSVVAGPEAGEDAAWRLEFPAPRHDRLAGFRVATLSWLSWLPVDPEIRGAMEQVVLALRQAGAIVQEAQPETFGDLREYYLVYSELMAATFSFSAGRSETARRASAKEYLAMGEEDLAAVARGLVASAHDYLALFRRREQYRAAYRDFFRSWDILLAPIALIAAFPHMPGSAEESSLEIAGVNVPYGRLAVYPGVATLSGQPATTFPAGRTREGLPIGLQAIGPYLEDRTPIRFAALLADEIGGYQPPPGYD